VFLDHLSYREISCDSVSSIIAKPLCLGNIVKNFVGLAGEVSRVAQLNQTPGLLVDYQITVAWDRSAEHTSEIRSLTNLVCRLLLETNT